MTVEANVWNKNSSSWREIKDSASISADVSTNHEISFQVVAGSITNARLDDMAAWTIKVRNAGTSGDPSDAALADFAIATAPAATDYLVGFLASGALRRFAASVFGGQVNIQAFTASGTYTPTTGMKNCIVFSTGGGGGGGGVDSDGTSVAAGGGGGAGSTCIELFSAATVGSSQSVTIGAAGTGGTVSGGTGGTGGTTTFGSLHSAVGGTGGAGVASTSESVLAGGDGGTATDSLINIPGGDGSWGIGFGSNAGVNFTASGGGGSSFWGGGARGEVSTAVSSTVGRAGRAYGSGDSGGRNRDQTAGIAGGAGAAGLCVIIEFL